MAVIKCKQPSIRIITQGAFLERFEQDVNIKIFNSEDDNIKYFLRVLNSRVKVNLDSETVKKGLNYLFENDYISQDNLEYIISDGTEYERDH